ncbi:MAG: hypothetical protein IJ733_05880 [Lachnospiraceae bacterium]|nr:hypothetical protein [Lachnospiraceae bacterium]
MINRKHKDRLFSFLFGREENKKWTLDLYNAVNGSHYTEPEEIEITTIEDVLYMAMKNDLSFILDWKMSIYEQNSSWNPNLPIRELMYAGKLYDKYIHKNKLNIYGKKLVTLPVPKLIVFYNGTEEKEDDAILELKDAFPEELREGVSDISVKVRMLNINKGRNRKLMEACKPLSEYAWFIEEIRENKRREMEIEEAVDRALDEMPEDFSIREFLMENRAEVKDMCLTEYNEEETMQMFKEEGEENGENKMGKLVEKLLSLGRTADLQKAATDKDIRHTLYKEFHIV